MFAISVHSPFLGSGFRGRISIWDWMLPTIWSAVYISIGPVLASGGTLTIIVLIAESLVLTPVRIGSSQFWLSKNLMRAVLRSVFSVNKPDNSTNSPTLGIRGFQEKYGEI